MEGIDGCVVGKDRCSEQSGYIKSTSPRHESFGSEPRRMKRPHSTSWFVDQCSLISHDWHRFSTDTYTGHKIGNFLRLESLAACTIAMVQESNWSRYCGLCILSDG